MKYRSQTRDCCLAYSLWQIGAVNKKALKEYEKIVANCLATNCSWSNIIPWLNKHVKKDAAAAIAHPTGVTRLEGRGIVLLEDPVENTHAISYENGIVLDPGHVEKRLSLEEYLKKYTEWTILRIHPVSKRV